MSTGAIETSTNWTRATSGSTAEGIEKRFWKLPSPATVIGASG